MPVIKKEHTILRDLLATLADHLSVYLLQIQKSKKEECHYFTPKPSQRQHLGRLDCRVQNPCICVLFLSETVDEVTHLPFHPPSMSLFRHLRSAVWDEALTLNSLLCRLTPEHRLCLLFYIPSSFSFFLLPVFPSFCFLFCSNHKTDIKLDYECRAQASQGLLNFVFRHAGLGILEIFHELGYVFLLLCLLLTV